MISKKFKSLGGRPTLFDEKATNRINVRISDSEQDILENYSNKFCISKPMLVRYLISNIDDIVEKENSNNKIELTDEQFKKYLQYTDEEFDRVKEIAEHVNLPTNIMIRNLSVLGSDIAKGFKLLRLFEVDDFITSMFKKSVKVLDNVSVSYFENILKKPV